MPQLKSKNKEERSPNPTPPKRDLKLEALLPYLEGKKPSCWPPNPSDLQTAVSLANEFKLKFVLESHQRTRSPSSTT
jgi:hypothetical protein